MYSFKVYGMNSKIPIVFAINNSYVKQLSVVIVSILLNADKNSNFEFNILSGDLYEENKKKFLELIGLNGHTKFNFIDMNIYTSGNELEKYMSRRQNYNYITSETYYRFFIPDIFPNYKKVIYIDADVIVNKDISLLYGENIDDYYAGVIHDVIIESQLNKFGCKIQQYPDTTIQEYYLNKLKGDESLKYFNAGVLLLNLDKIRNDNVTDRLWEFSKNESPLEYQDQDVLNAVIGRNVKYLEYEWNVLKPKKFYTKNKKKELRKKLIDTYNNPAIFHFVGSDKPWTLVKEGNYNYKCFVQWWKYYKLSPFFDNRDLDVYKNIVLHKRFPSRFNFIAIEIFNFKIFSIYVEEHRFYLYVFQLIRLRIKLPSFYYKNSINED